MTQFLLRSGVTSVLLAPLTACASLMVAETVPLTPSDMAPRQRPDFHPRHIDWQQSTVATICN